MEYGKAPPDGKICQGHPRMAQYTKGCGQKSLPGSVAPGTGAQLSASLFSSLFRQLLLMDTSAPLSFSLHCLLPFVSLPQTSPVTSNFMFPFHLGHSAVLSRVVVPSFPLLLFLVLALPICHSLSIPPSPPSLKETIPLPSPESQAVVWHQKPFLTPGSRTEAFGLWHLRAAHSWD